MNSWKGLECSKLVQERKISLTWMLSISLISHPSWHLLTITDWMTNVNLWLSCHRHPMVCNASAGQSDLRALVYKKKTKVQPVAGRLYTVLFSLSATTWRGMEAHICIFWLTFYIHIPSYSGPTLLVLFTTKLLTLVCFSYMVLRDVKLLKTYIGQSELYYQTNHPFLKAPIKGDVKKCEIFWGTHHKWVGGDLGFDYIF